MKELQKLLNERDEIACHAHFLLARIYLESDPGDPNTTEQYQQKAKEHQQKGEKLFSQSAKAYFNRSIMAGTVNKTLDWLNKAVDLDPDHYDSREARALTYYALRKYDGMETDASVMIGNESNNSKGYSLRAIARREKTIREDEKELLKEAIRDHNKAIKLSPDEPELYDQRRRTHLRMGNYEQALSDTRACARLGPDERRYHFHIFCALVALGRHEDAKAEYATIVEAGPGAKTQFNRWAAKEAFNILGAGRELNLPAGSSQEDGFWAMHDAANYYRELDAKAKRVVISGFRAAWSSDGTELAYSQGFPGANSIEILHLESGRMRLLTIPGKDPVWSADGGYIAFVRE